MRRRTLLSAFSHWAQDSLIDPEDDGSGDADSGHECMCASIIARVNAPPVFEPTEHILDLVALAIERSIMRDGDYAVCF